RVDQKRHGDLVKRYVGAGSGRRRGRRAREPEWEIRTEVRASRRPSGAVVEGMLRVAILPVIGQLRKWIKVCPPVAFRPVIAIPKGGGGIKNQPVVARAQEERGDGLIHPAI